MHIWVIVIAVLSDFVLITSAQQGNLQFEYTSGSCNLEKKESTKVLNVAIFIVNNVPANDAWAGVLAIRRSRHLTRRFNCVK